METISGWIRDFADYIDAEFGEYEEGELCVLKQDAPEQAKTSYLKYIHWLNKYIPQFEEVELENGKIVAIHTELATEERIRKQLIILEKLVNDGVIRRERR